MPEPTQSPPSYFDPPSFDPPSFDFGLDEAGSADLPIYTRRVPPPPREQRHREPKEFPFKLTRKGKLCAVLTMLGDHASSTTMPSILEGSDVAGSVKLTLESGDAIQAVVISVGIIPLNADSLELKRLRLGKGSDYYRRGSWRTVHFPRPHEDPLVTDNGRSQES